MAVDENGHFIFRALITLKLLVLLTIHFGARSAEINIDIQSDRCTDQVP